MKVKVDVAPIIGRDPPILEVGFEVNDATMRRADVLLDVTSLATHVVLKLAPRLLEPVTDRDVDVLVCDVLVRGSGYHQEVVRDADIDPDAVEPPVVLVVIGRLDQHAAADHTIDERFQLVDRVPNIILERQSGGMWWKLISSDVCMVLLLARSELQRPLQTD